MLKSRRCKCFKWGPRTPEKKNERLCCCWSHGKPTALAKVLHSGNEEAPHGVSQEKVYHYLHCFLLDSIATLTKIYCVIVFISPHWQVCASFHKVTQLWGFMSSHSKGEFPVRETPFKKEILDLGTQGDIHGTGRTLDWREDIMRGRSLENKESKLFL